MKKLFYLPVLIAILASFVSCANNTALVTYENNGEKYSVNLGEIRELINPYLVQDMTLASDSVTHKLILFDTYLMPDLAYFYQTEKGFTETEYFITNYNGLDDKIKLFTLYDEGVKIISNELTSAEVKAAKASHILFRVDDTTTDDDGNIVAMDEAASEALWAEAEIEAQNVLDYLVSSKDFDTDFEMSVNDYSDDYASAAQGGDLGFFIEGQMVPEFEEAVFSMKKSGLVTELVRTDYGFHIIYVTEPAKGKNIEELEEILDPSVSYYMLSFIQQDLYMKYEASNKITYYEVVTNEEAGVDSYITVDGVDYAFSDIPEDAVIISMFDIDYTWAECLDIISWFVPDFESSMNDPELAALTFNDNITQFNSLLFYVSQAKAEGLDQGAKFDKIFEEEKETYLKTIASDIMFMEWYEEIDALLTEETISNYYEIEKAQGLLTTEYIANDDGTYDQVYMTYDEAYDQVKEDYSYNMSIEKYDAWKLEVEEAYNVEYNEDGLVKLAELLADDLDDFLNSEEGQTYQQMMIQQQLQEQMGAYTE